MDAHNQNILPLRKPKYTQAETGCNMFAESHFISKIHIGCIMSKKTIVSISLGSILAISTVEIVSNSDVYIGIIIVKTNKLMKYPGI